MALFQVAARRDRDAVRRCSATIPKGVVVTDRYAAYLLVEDT
jgi:hypothetical protein